MSDSIIDETVPKAGTKSRVFIDNATVAGAGRALYQESVDQFDLISLSHLVTACLLYDQVILDGSSRYRRIHVVGTGYTNKTYAAIWTWEIKYPALKDLGLKDIWLGSDLMMYDIVEYLMKLSKPITQLLTENKIIDLVPQAYRDPAYFGLERIYEIRDDLESKIGKLTTEELLFVIYSWRGICYHEASKNVNLIYLPNPHRQQFIEDILIPGEQIIDYSEKALNFLVKVLSSPKFSLLKELVNNEERKFEVNLPPFFSYLTHQAKSRGDIIKVLKEVRNSSQGESLRRFFMHYSNSYNNGDLLGLAELKHEVNQSFENFNRRYGIDKDMPSIKLRPKLPLVGLGDIEVDKVLDFKFPKQLYSEIFQKKYLSLMWNIAEANLRFAFPVNHFMSLSPIERDTDDIQWVYIQEPDSRYEIDYSTEMEEDVRIRGGSSEEHDRFNRNTSLDDE